MYFAPWITLFLLPIALADNTLRGSKTKLRLVTTRVVGDPCASLEGAYQNCFDNLTAANKDRCIDCVNGKSPTGEVLCSDFHDFACNGPTSCPSCGECQDEISAWLVCLHDEGGCTPRECPAGRPSGNETCPGGSMNACLGMCVTNCGA